MARRTKAELEAASRLIKLYLSDTDNNPHKAWDEYIKFYLVSGQQLPGYIKGIKDFIKVSKEYQKEYEYKQQLEQRKQENKNLEQDYIEKIKGLSKEGDYQKTKEGDYQKTKEGYSRATGNSKLALCSLMHYLHNKEIDNNKEKYNKWKFTADEIKTFIEYGII